MSPLRVRIVLTVGLAFCALSLGVARARPTERGQGRPTMKMERAAFWKIIADARTGASDDEDFLARVTTRLKKSTGEELLDFQRHFHDLHARSYSWTLWGAAYLMNGGCSDDGFDYFRAWLIARGQRVFERAVANPDSLAELGHSEGELEAFMYVAPKLYQEKTGREMPDSVYAGTVRPVLGEGWDFDDANQMKTRYPRLFAKYGHGG